MAVIKLKYSIKKLENPIAQVTPKITVMIAKSGDTHIRNDKTNKIKIPSNAKMIRKRSEKLSENDPTTIRKLSENDPKTTRKLSENNPTIIRK